MVTRDEMIAKWVSGNSMSDNIDKMEGERRNHVGGQLVGDFKEVVIMDGEFPGEKRQNKSEEM